MKVRVSPTSSSVDLKNIKMSMNPFCEIAVEESVRLKESKVAESVTALTIGPKQSQETLRTALAMGCDSAIHILTDRRTDQELDSINVAKVISKIQSELSADVVIVGKQSIDGDSGCTGGMVGGILNAPTISMCANVDLESKTVERETDAGTETVKFGGFPVVLTADLRLNEPRYATLPNIMKAKKKKIDVRDLSDVLPEGDIVNNEVVEVYEPKEREAGRFVEDVDELVGALKEEKGLL